MSETLKPYPKEFSLPSTEDVISLTTKLRDLIDQNHSYSIDVPGQGTTLASDITFPDGSRRELGWVQISDEEGILVWSDKREGFEKKDDYNLIYVDPDKPAVTITGVRRNHSYPIAPALPKPVDWADLRDLFSLVQQVEEA